MQDIKVSKYFMNILSFKNISNVLFSLIITAFIIFFVCFLFTEIQMYKLDDLINHATNISRYVYIISNIALVFYCVYKYLSTNDSNYFIFFIKMLFLLVGMYVFTLIYFVLIYNILS